MDLLYYAEMLLDRNDASSASGRESDRDKAIDLQD